MTPTLTAYHLYDSDPVMQLVPASREREWMDGTPEKFVKRCLPLLIANQSGWHILTRHAIRVTWHGGMDKSSLVIEHDGRHGQGLAVSHFGSGILTWNIPWIFRTSPGYNLLVRGPANMPMDGVSPLEGVVESDWSCATFTMNWKFTRPGLPVLFDVGFPICLLVPQRRGELEGFVTRLRGIGEEPEMHAEYSTWAASRLAFNADLQVPGSDATRARWQKDYFQGKGVSEHQTKLALSRFHTEEEQP